MSQVSSQEITFLTSQTVRAFGDKVNQLALNQTPLQRHTRNQCLAPVAEMIDAYVRSDFEADEDWRLWSNDRLIDFLNEKYPHSSGGTDGNQAPPTYKDHLKKINLNLRGNRGKGMQNFMNQLYHAKFHG